MAIEFRAGGPASWRLRWMIPGAAATVLGLALMGCRDQGCGACTAMFATVTARVVDEAGAPVEGATVEVVNQRTNVRREIDTPSIGYDGLHAVFTDALLPDVRRVGDDYTVTVRKDAQSASVSMRFGTDACRCHVMRQAGPETIVVR